ncbi:hypothetical protein SprV_0501863700 [Sparganum proliferum]
MAGSRSNNCIGPTETGTEGTAVQHDKIYNSENICCPRCFCIVFRKNTAFLTDKEFMLPVIARKSDLTTQSEEFPRELTSQFWTVNVMTDFENVGFCNAVGTIKYLVCADCEIGPIGYHDTSVTQPPEFHIACCRVTPAQPEDSVSSTPATDSSPILVTQPST